MFYNKSMGYFLTKEAVLKRLETPSVYHMQNDELYELDESSFEFLRNCAAGCGGVSGDADFISYCPKEGILSEERTGTRLTPLIKAPVPSLRYLELQITDKCNLRCRHCYIGETGSRELSSSDIRNILTEFEKMQGLRLLITGGEPLLHSRFPEINEMLPDFFLRKVLFTNGLLLNEKVLQGINVDEIQISVDGLEYGHDALRGRGAFRAALEAVKLCVSSGLEVSVSTMVHRKNLQDFGELETLFKALGIKDWTVDVPCTAGRLAVNREEFLVSPEQGGKYLDYGFGGGIHGSAPGFACGLHLMSVMADGRAARCTFYADSAAGRIEEGLEACWKRIRPVGLDELSCDCGHIEACRGGCRYRAGVLGDPLGKDLYRCALYGILK